MNLKEELISLIEIIKKLTGKNQGEISLEAGYKEKHLSQIMSRDDVSQKVIDNLKKTYAKVLNNEYNVAEPEVLYKVTRSDKDILKDLLQLRALAKTLFHEMAAVKAERENVPLSEAIYQLNESTNQNLLNLAGLR